jgi:hypothetical protein
VGLDDPYAGLPRIYLGGPQRAQRAQRSAHRGLCGGWRRLPRLGGPLSAAARRGEADLEARRAAEPQSAHLKRDRRRHPDRWHRSGTPSPAPHRGDRRRHPNLLAAWRLGARKTTPRRSPTARRADRPPPRTGRAKAQRRQELGISAGVEDFQTVGIGAGHPAPPPRHGDRRRHPRPLCGSAPLREKNNAATITARSKSRSATTRLLRPSESRKAPPTPTESSVCRPLCPLCLCGSFARHPGLSAPTSHGRCDQWIAASRSPQASRRLSAHPVESRRTRRMGFSRRGARGSTQITSAQARRTGRFCQSLCRHRSHHTSSPTTTYPTPLAYKPANRR